MGCFAQTVPDTFSTGEEYTRNGRILFSFGNWIAVCADHSYRKPEVRNPKFEGLEEVAKHSDEVGLKA
jgi:hypothetical protein